MEIKNCVGEVIFRDDSKTMLETLLAARKAGADLSRANLSGADLSRADLSGADLSGANLSRANLRGANLREANLVRANLSRAHLSRANLRGANLREANLSEANLRGANLSGADLSRANLRGANLREADLVQLVSTRSIVAAGEIVGWKKLQGGQICQLGIPVEARRVGGVIGRKCRAEFAVVLSGKGYSSHNSSFRYALGETVRPDKFDDNPLVECSHGIHFFITREEAEAY